MRNFIQNDLAGTKVQVLQFKILFIYLFALFVSENKPWS